MSEHYKIPNNHYDKSFVVLYLVFLINCFNSWHFFVDREENKDLRFLVLYVLLALDYFI